MADSLLTRTAAVSARPTTRLAPSPTGALHLGNASTFLLTWALARKFDWRVVLRIDDLDSPRVRPGADRQAIEILRWLGMDWDGEPIYETQQLAIYDQALRRLAADGWIFPCGCTRSQIAAAAMSAPHHDPHELRYAGTCRPRQPQPIEFAHRPETAWRVRVPLAAIEFHDELAGPQSEDLQRRVGDFLVTNKQGLPAYQLAVVLDDRCQQVTDVVRGADLLMSTARQIWLHRLLGLAPPRYWHVPLVVGPDGERLAKRHGGFRLDEYRRRGVPVEKIIGLVAFWSGFPVRQAMSLAEFVESFQLPQMSREPVIFQPEDHLWLVTP